jgi:hypothetical protein
MADPAVWLISSGYMTRKSYKAASWEATEGARIM